MSRALGCLLTLLLSWLILLAVALGLLELTFWFASIVALVL